MNFPLKLVITSTPFRKEGASLKLKTSVSDAPALIKELKSFSESFRDAHKFVTLTRSRTEQTV